MVLLDTGFVIDVMRGDEDAVIYLGDLLESHEPAGVSAITTAELHHGVARSERPVQERARIRRALEGVTTYPVDHELAAEAGEVHGTLAREGKMLDLEDVIIGVTARREGEVLLTRNEEHHSRIEGVRLLVY